jgi:hypothetical protein
MADHLHHDAFEELRTIPGAPLWTRKHDYAPDGSAFFVVCEARGGGYDGTLNMSGHPPFPVSSADLKQCCEMLEARFREVMPDHQCGPRCIDWVTAKTMFGKPAGKIQ